MNLTLSPRDHAAIHQLLLATPMPGDNLLSQSALNAVVALLPCDMIGVGEMDDRGYLLRGFDLPDGYFGDLGPQVCDGPVPTGLIHLGEFENNQ
ncbi:hypothetical protein BH18ACT9_BH18ACT9_21170 [soil metagenome]